VSQRIRVFAPPPTTHPAPQIVGGRGLPVLSRWLAEATAPGRDGASLKFAAKLLTELDKLPVDIAALRCGIGKQVGGAGKCPRGVCFFLFFWGGETYI
jgi:hypothetical protein